MEYSLFLYELLNQKFIQEEMRLISTGASQQFIGLETARNFKILVPSEDLLEQYGIIIKPIYEMKAELYQENDVLMNAKNILLPRLISGKLSVENLDIKFPPSMEEVNA